jgi:uncharacterized protein (DUF1697 family)
MTVFVALLRAVNVGGTGRLPMADLVRMAEVLGFREPETYIASGNLIFQWDGTEAEVVSGLGRALADYAGTDVGVVVRTAAELAAVAAANPFPDAQPSRTVVLFLPTPPPPDALGDVVAPDGEEVRPGRRELYVHYPNGMGRSRLKLPAAAHGTGRNMNTVRKLVELCQRRTPGSSQ